MMIDGEACERKPFRNNSCATKLAAAKPALNVALVVFTTKGGSRGSCTSFSRRVCEQFCLHMNSLQCRCPRVIASSSRVHHGQE